jgi:hypothetical protein
MPVAKTWKAILLGSHANPAHKVSSVEMLAKLEEMDRQLSLEQSNALNFFDFLIAANYTNDQIDTIAKGTFTGDLAAPWAAFRDALAAEAAEGRRPYGVIPQCTIRTSVSPNFAIDYLKLETRGAVEIKALGTTRGFTIDGMGRGFSYYGVAGMRVGEIISSTETGGIGIYVRRAHFSTFDGLKSRGGSFAGIVIDGCIVSRFYDMRSASDGDRNWVQTPANGISIAGTAWQAGEFDPEPGNPGAGWRGESYNSWCYFETPVAERCPVGLTIQNSFGNLFKGGTFEACTDTGLRVGTTASLNKFEGVDLEVNTNFDLVCLGPDNLFLGIDSGGVSKFEGVSARRNKVIAGKWTTLTLDASTKLNLVEGVTATTITDSSIGTDENRVSNCTTGTAWVNDRTVEAAVSGAANRVPSSSAVVAYTEKAWVKGNPVVTTSGTSVVLATGLPAGVNEIMLLLDGVSKTGTSNLLFQLRVAGAFVATGYSAGAGAAGTTVAAFHTIGFPVINNLDASETTGEVVFRRTTGNRWISNHAVLCDAAGRGSVGGGYITLAGAVDGIRVTTVDGVGAFDLGSISVWYR